MVTCDGKLGPPNSGPIPHCPDDHREAHIGADGSGIDCTTISQIDSMTYRDENNRIKPVVLPYGRTLAINDAFCTMSTTTIHCETPGHALTVSSERTELH
ncbi:hypothetical protein EBN03_15400 [Nocardia stercoris]|uniref:Uncharacterized protein n=2 Tax=Nocardia stercoris TaxID=2483361 RepID=A0A3M2L3R9_9NOCA|nr:hypothetical protein EBN03_15400 [Nocardia stercoris]